MNAVARRHFADAVTFYRAGNYEAARVEFQAAYDLCKEPDLLHNLSLTAEQQKRYTEAIELAERHIREKTDMGDLERDAARGRVLRLREQLSDAKPAALVPVPPAAPSQPQPASSPIATPALAADSTQAQPTAAPPPTARPPVPRGAVALISIGATAALVGAGLGASAQYTQRQLEQDGPFSYEVFEGLVGRGQSLNTAAIVLGVSGGALVAGGVVWAVAHRVSSGRRSERRPEALAFRGTP